jgi:transposase
MEQVSFEQVVSRGCGLDVHKQTVVATINGAGIKKESREFGTTTRSLTALREWLLSKGINRVAMESTGVYRKPVYHVPEAKRKAYLKKELEKLGYGVSLTPNQPPKEKSA